MRDDGILSGPIDDPDGSVRSRRAQIPTVAARLGLVVEHDGSGTTGAIVRFAPPQVVIRDRHGRDHTLRVRDGAFSIDGRPVALCPPAPEPAPTADRRTASGSIAVDDVPARVARGSRIFVEGTHDAELIEKVWGDDLRVEGIVVQVMDGADDLQAIVRGFGPGPRRRLGILLDHLVADTKESRLAEGIDHPDVRICGHPFVDVWQTVRPEAAGLEAWPDVPHGQPWKEGILAAIGHPGPPGAFWKELLGRVEGWNQLEPSLVGAVESLIDFVAPPDEH